ncbi:HEAT repeat domain-containing protein [Candidatus Sumerlaeota bacterium]|nr:HEAT repeat domain-containing protein [Candidatus Sumerlaeota bacterium]
MEPNEKEHEAEKKEAIPVFGESLPAFEGKPPVFEESSSTFDEPLPIFDEATFKKGEEDARTFLERLLHTSAWAKLKVLLYPENHPLVQEQLKELHHLIAESLRDRTDLVLEFKPGRIVVDKRYEIGEKEDIARFSEEMYRRRVARLRFDNSLDLSSLFRFLKFINTDIDALHKMAASGNSFFPTFRGIHLDEVDYGRLSRIHGESLDYKDEDDKEHSVLEILFGKTGAGRYKGEPVSQYIQISENILEPLRDLIEMRKDIPPPDPTLPPGVMVSRAFRNLVDEIHQRNPEQEETLKKELAWSLFRMSPRIRSELLIEEMQDKGRTGNLFKLFEYLSQSEIKETLSSLRTQMDSEGFPDLFDEMIQVFEAIHQKGNEGPEKKKKTQMEPEAVSGKEFLDQISGDLSLENITRHYHRIVQEIFQATQVIPAIGKCLDALLGEINGLIAARNWEPAIRSMKNIIFALKSKEGLEPGDRLSFTGKMQDKITPTIKEILRKALNENDTGAMEKAGEILRLINLTPEQVLLKSLGEVEDRSLRKKILSFVLESEQLPLNTINEMLHHEEWFVVRNAVTLIKEKEDAYFLPLLEKTIDHPHPSVVKETLIALTRIRAEKVQPLLYQVFQDNSRIPEVRALALDCLGGFHNANTRELFLALLHDRRNPFLDKEAREAGIRQLEHFPEPGIIKELTAFIKKFHLFHQKGWSDLKKSALYALEQMNTPESKAAYEQAEKLLTRKDQIGS